jgi:hypothetical protein
LDRSFTITGTKFAPSAAALVLIASMLAACGGGGGGSTPSTPIGVGPTSVPTTRASASPIATATSNPQAFICPTGATTAATGARGTESKRRVATHLAKSTLTSDYTKVAVTYSRPTVTSSVRQIEGRESALGATLLGTFDYPQQNITQRVVSVPTAQLATAQASFRTQAGVVSVGVTGERRFHATTAALITNDPYFAGGGANKANPPYYESATVAGQWDMHVIGLEHAFGYSVPGTGYTANPLALGSSTIKIAVIDTGVDPNHPELSGKIAGQKCFITDLSGTQHTGSFSTDGDGHGTNVAGIAAAATNNGLGFAAAGGNSMVYAYRVFPTPDDNCANSTSTDPQCSSDTTDIAAAIKDAVTAGANVISLSLGGGSCTGGTDSDPAEGAAITAALTANVIVVAASGNAGGATVDAPGCVNGVIAVGASALADGTPTGTTAYSSTLAPNATAASVVEYVPSYSQYGTTNTPKSTASWGIVAPGGDPSNADVNSSGSTDDLHWIENIWTTTPAGGPADTTFAGACGPDFNGSFLGLSATPDCRTLIAGTSMATPHVAGAVALILAVNRGAYGTPAQMKQLLCSTADDIQDSHQGCGRLNLYRAMAHAIGDSNPP